MEDAKLSRQERRRSVDQTMSISGRGEAHVKTWRREGMWPVQELQMVHPSLPTPRAFTHTLPSAVSNLPLDLCILGFLIIQATFSLLRVLPRYLCLKEHLICSLVFFLPFTHFIFFILLCKYLTLPVSRM